MGGEWYEEVIAPSLSSSDPVSSRFLQLRHPKTDVCDVDAVYEVNKEDSGRWRRMVFVDTMWLTLHLTVMDLDRKVRQGRKRLAQEVEVLPLPPMPVEKSEQLSILEEKIKNLLESMEALREAGKVDEAEALMRQVHLLNIEKTALTLQPHTDKVIMLTQEKKMALCETCGSFLIANDSLERTQSHVT